MTSTLTFNQSAAVRPAAGSAAVARAVPATGADLLQVRNLSKIFGPKPERALQMLREGKGRNEIFEQTGHMVAVNDVSLSVRSGEIFVVMGLSGSGKSTLVRLLNRLIEPSAGQVILEGQDIAAMSAGALQQVRREKMSMVFQSFALLPNRNVIDNVAYGLEVAGMPRTERYEKAQKALARVGLDAYARMFPSELSGGMQQRVGLARALAVNPSVLLMDEAFSALDPLIRSEMQNELLRLQKEERRTIVFISHDIEEAIKIGGRIGIMKDGCLIQVGTPAELIQSPANDFVRDFFRHVDVSRFLKAANMLEQPEAAARVACNIDGPAERLLATLADGGIECAYVCDEAGRYQGCVTQASLHLAGAGAVRAAFLADAASVNLDTDLQQLTDMALRQHHDVPVLDTAGRLAGIVSCRTILKHVMQRRHA
ncbi:quaternary amine ABC transporter ATP-binding protein [Ideonella livida]|uniref:Quaternary amine transport ATP-binding protein n=1 Tax=Ideonella livida TaxID=2707176 RepID=A0A7C9PI60_9BURK|nr:glycine betaine/L-proline ABC transporter ATP-binding protein [Ideonella livida]NDY91792.1 glycine betaine/L-proline ABC transporter ATP-binding protein [Ideonella livida]